MSEVGAEGARGSAGCTKVHVSQASDAGRSFLQTGVKSTLIECLLSIFMGLIYLNQKQEPGVCILTYAHDQI